MVPDLDADNLLVDWLIILESLAVSSTRSEGST